MNLTNSKLYFIHVGLPLDHHSIPTEIQKEAGVQLPRLRDRMQAEGYGYELVFASPEDGLENFKSQLGSRGPDGVIIGGGVVGNPQMRFFMEQIIDVIRTSAPKSKILLIGRPEQAPDAFARWFPKA